MSTTVTVSTSVILAPTRTVATDYIVYFPNISTNGRLITVRDNDGYASTNHAVILSTTAGATFATGGSQIQINQPFGFITLNSQSSGNYTILNTFAFPEGSAAAFVSQVTTSNLITSTIQMIDISTQSTNTFFTSTGFMYLNSNVMGQVSQQQLESTVVSLGTVGYISTLIIPPINPAIYIATGFSSNQYQESSTDPVGSIVYSEGTIPSPWNNATRGYTFGFSNGGNDVVVGNQLFLACGDSLASSSNGSYLQYSIDGCNWNYTNTFLSSPQIRFRLSYANGMYHAVGSNFTTGGLGTILWSRDAITWNNTVTTVGGSVIPFVSGYSRGITYGKGRWVAAGTQTGSILAASLLNSTDGSNWFQSGTAPLLSEVVWDVGFNGTSFIALVAANTANGNIIRSTDGITWGVTASASLNLNSGVTNGGYIAGNGAIWLVTGSNSAPSGQMMWYSQDNGESWSANPAFATGRLSRPYWDGAYWWVGYYNPAAPSAQAIYYSGDGITWDNTYIGTTGFLGGFPQGFATRNAQSNYSISLLSTVAGLEASFQTSTLGANTISTNSITAATEAVSSLFVNYLSSGIIFNAYANISTLSNINIVSQTESVSSLFVNTISTNSITAATEAVGSIFTNTISTNSITAATMTLSSLFVNVQVISTTFETVNNISTMRVDNISAGIANIMKSDISSINTNYLSAGYGLISSLGIGHSNVIFPLDVRGQTRIVAQGSISTTRFGVQNPGTDTLCLMAQTGWREQATTSLFFGNRSVNYPMARIAAQDVGSGIYQSRLIFQTASSGAEIGLTLQERMRINEFGNIGINTSTPQTTLDVNGSAYISSGLTLAGNVEYGSLKIRGGLENGMMIYDPGVTNNTGWWLGEALNFAPISTFQIGRILNGNPQANNGLFIASNGNVGIGNTTPATTLVVETPTTNSLTGLGVRFTDVYTIIGNNTASGNNNGSIQCTKGGSAGAINTIPWALNLNPLGGNVGVGMSNPSYNLSVAGITSLKSTISYADLGANPLPAQLRIETDPGSTVLKLGAYYTNGEGAASVIQSSDFFNNQDNGVALLLNPLGGNVGIRNTTPATNLVVNAGGTTALTGIAVNSTDVNVVIGNNSGGNWGSIQCTSGGSVSAIGTSPYALMLQPRGGTVVVGTGVVPNTATNLHVVGTLSADPYAQILIQGTGGTPNGALALSNASGWGRFAVAGAADLYLTGTRAGDLLIDTRSATNKILLGNNGVAGLICSNANIGIRTTEPVYPLDVNGVLNLRAGTANDPNVEPVNMSNTYIRFDGTNATTDWAYLRQIGGANEIHIALDFHDDTNDGNFSIRNVGSSGSSSDPIRVLFTVNSNGNVTALGNVTAYSDVRYKENIVQIENALSSIKEMRGVFYNPIGQSTSRVGVIAQEIEKVLPQVVCTDSSEKATKSVAYGNITAVLIEAVKELSESVEELRNKIAKLKIE